MSFSHSVTTTDSANGMAEDVAPDAPETLSSAGDLSLGRAWPFLLLLVPYLFAWYIPFIWCWYQWTDSNHPQFIQPWIPLLSLGLAWSRRDRLISVARYTEKHSLTTFWERGNILPLTAGCLLYLFAHLVQIKGVAIAALLLIAFGTIYALYGGRVVKSLRLPFFFSLLTIPPPDSAVDGVILLLVRKMIKLASVVLNLAHIPNHINGYLMQLDRSGEVVSFPFRMGGAGIFVPVAILLLWWALFRRRKPLVLLTLPLTGLIIAFFLVLFRASAAAATAAAMPGVSSLFLNLNGWVWIAASVGMTLGLDALASRIRVPQKAGARAMRTTGAALTRTGRALSIVTLPFDYLFQGLGFLGTLWKRAERKIEQGLKRLMPKKKSRSRRR